MRGQRFGAQSGAGELRPDADAASVAARMTCVVLAATRSTRRWIHHRVHVSALKPRPQVIAD